MSKRSNHVGYDFYHVFAPGSESYFYSDDINGARRIAEELAKPFCKEMRGGTLRPCNGIEVAQDGPGKDSRMVYLVPQRMRPRRKVVGKISLPAKRTRQPKNDKRKERANKKNSSKGLRRPEKVLPWNKSDQRRKR